MIDNVDWSQFKVYLLQRMTESTAMQRMRYTKKYYHGLLPPEPTNDKIQSPLQMKPDKRIHIMKAMSALARFMGLVTRWQEIKQRHNLTWSTGNENLAVFQRFFLDDSKALDNMIEWVRNAIKILSADMASIVTFNCLTGLRPNECIASAILIKDFETFKTNYFNENKQCLEHFRHPNIFLRRRKSAFISIITKDLLSGIHVLGSRTPVPTYESIRFRLAYQGIGCHLSWCRKIFGSYLRQHGGIESEIIDLLSGRVPPTVFARYYFSASSDYRTRVLVALSALKKELLPP
jgi:hypothetical protein